MGAPRLVKGVVTTALGAYYGWLVAARVRPEYEYIFILSHIRSGSSLLSALLSSHPAISGYGETHIQYRTAADLRHLRSKVLARKRRFPRLGCERYILGKVLHSSLTTGVSSAFWLSGKVRPVFLVREPGGTVRSMFRSLGHSESAVRAYYLNRLPELAENLRSISTVLQPMVITYTDLTTRSKETLWALQEYLGLTQPLSETYSITRQTGIKGVGDTSELIRSGRILRRREISERPASMNNGVWDEIMRAYDGFWDAVRAARVYRGG